MKFSFPALFILLSTVSIPAAITITQGSQDFGYKYEMNVNPSTQNLDGNAASDWFGTGTPQTYVGGVGFSNQTSSQVLFRTDFGSTAADRSLSRNLFGTTDSPFTIETRIRREGVAAAGSAGWFSLALHPVGATQSLRLNIQDNQFSFNGTPTSPIPTGSNLGDYITVRVAYDGANQFYVWRNSLLLNPNLSTPFLGSNGTFTGGPSGSWLIGDYTGSIAGDWSVDYIRVGVGALAIPEPSRVAFLALFAAGIGLHRRR